jgi:hypothetical protein
LGENKIIKGPGGKPRKFENKKYKKRRFW